MHCEYTASGNWLDLVRSFNLQNGQLAVDNLFEAFFILNSDIQGTVSAHVGSVVGTGEPSFWAQQNAAAGSHTAGIHFRPPFSYTRVKTHW